MPNGSAFEHAVKNALETPGLGVGIHLSLVGEKSVAPASELGALADENGLLPSSYPVFTRQFVGRKFTPGQVRTEIHAQVEKALAAGIKPTHIDSHQHLHMLPGVFDIVIEVAKWAGISVIRVPLERDGPGPRGISARLIQTWVLSRIARSRLQQVQASGLRTADWFWGLGVSGKMNEANLMKTLQRLRPGVNEIMCHPGQSDPETEAHYSWGYSWNAEAAALQSESVLRYVKENNIRLANFADAWE